MRIRRAGELRESVFDVIGVTPPAHSIRRQERLILLGRQDLESQRRPVGVLRREGGGVELGHPHPGPAGLPVEPLAAYAPAAVFATAALGDAGLTAAQVEQLYAAQGVVSLFLNAN